MTRPQKYKDVIKALQARGWVFLRDGKGSHEIWGLPDESAKHSIPRHREISAGVIGDLVKKLDNPPTNWK